MLFVGRFSGLALFELSAAALELVASMRSIVLSVVFRVSGFVPFSECSGGAKSAGKSLANSTDTEML